jgi:diguanylate cyclase (GGDEF)-like protein
MDYQPRIVISDWVMPIMDGLELCRQIRLMSCLQYVYVVLLTIHGEKDNVTEAFDAGVDDFLAKPVRESELVACVRSAVRTVTMHDALIKKSQGADAVNGLLSNMNNRLRKLAITDDLTGLFNRRHALQRLDDGWALANRYGQVLSVILIDIDHFKRINDTYGHPAGDVVLHEIATLLKQSARATDTVCRIGGEEFLIICPAETAKEAAVCAERCRTAVAGKQFVIGEQTIQATISAGVACRTASMSQWSHLLDNADRALYTAKHSGRNRVEVLDDSGDKLALPCSDTATPMPSQTPEPANDPPRLTKVA